jgi:hypothetical protein
MQAVAIILFSIGSAVVYGILHDQLTARVCVEYFTIGHAPLFITDDPLLIFSAQSAAASQSSR